METLNFIIKEITIKIQDLEITPENAFLFLILLAGIALILRALRNNKNASE